MGSLKFGLFLVLLALVDTISGAAVSHSRVKREKTAKHTCHNAQQLEKGKPYKFSSDITKPGKYCEWAIVGDTDCKPQLDCKNVNLKKDDDCSDEYMQIADGAAGMMKVCGKVNFDKPIIASGEGRDIFVRFQDGGFGSKGFQCEATCIKGKGKDLLQLPEEYKRKEDSRCVCGLQNKDDRIVGGVDAKMMEFPWQAAIVTAGTRMPKCGSTVLNDRFILTAAHCFYFDDAKPSDIEVLTHAYILDLTKKENARDVALGKEGSIRGSGYNLKAYTDADEGTQRHRVVEIINHPLFSEQYDFDYALLRIEKKIDFTASDSPTPICLPAGLQYEATWEGTTPWVVGWGMPDENAGSTTRVLQKLDVPIIPLDKCMSWAPGMITQRMVCAGYEEGKRDACTGDSGGPLILKQKNKQWWQIGIVSWGEGCAGYHKPGYYSRVTEQQQWIQYFGSKNDAKWCKNTK